MCIILYFRLQAKWKALERDSSPSGLIVIHGHDTPKSNGKKQNEEDYPNFEAWIAEKRATQRADAHVAHANTSTSPAPVLTASPNQLEQQAVTTIGDWLLNKAKEATPVAADLSRPAATTPAAQTTLRLVHMPRRRKTKPWTPRRPREKEKQAENSLQAPAPGARVRDIRSRGPDSSEATQHHGRRAAPCPSPPPAEGDFFTVVSKAAQRRARTLEAAAVAIDPAVVGTALFRTSAPGGSFSGSLRLTLAAALAKRPGALAVRVNHRRNIVAADASTPTCLSELLAIRELGGVPVTAREPADRRSSTGFVYGVDGDLMNAELLAGITSTVPVLSATREGVSVKLRYAEPLPPELVVLLGLQLRVRHVRPLLGHCQQCGRFGHVAEACQRKGACIRCGRQHLEAESCKPRCVNCGGAHAADTPTCPRWQEERRVAALMAVTPTPLSRRAVKAAVREESREVRSYAAAVKNKFSRATPWIPACSAHLLRRADPSCQRRAPPGRSCLLPHPLRLQRTRGTPSLQTCWPPCRL
ncbi:hypothetical protein HPB52_020433 [Rhipicephalus sanguineus]|uniref:CCHC-type domain-containing protein n=1 Tax=Rhipicephalus sanguineus TaxID=34632 RepID=A0A9D4QBJ9_RHISA|nr:hypothetical protein HPB52_020433 [Rhipicephalus sanguineus]